MILWNAELTRRLTCTKQERAELPMVVDELLILHAKVKVEGLKNLQEDPEIRKKPLLAYGLRLILEGVSGETLEEILAIYLVTSSLEGFEFLVQCIYTEALLSLASGDSSEVLLRKLAPYCGAEYATELLETLSPGNGRKSL
jgi:flagellar motor component MotA